MRTIKAYIVAGLTLLPSLANAQHITTESTEIDCGQVLFQHPVSAKYIMTNSGREPLTISRVLTSCGCTEAVYPTEAIAPGKTFTITATYDAKTMGHFLKQIAVYSNESHDPVMLSLKGRVVGTIEQTVTNFPYRLGELEADANVLEFDNVNRGDLPSQQIHIRNTTLETLQPVVMQLPPYLRATVTPQRLSPGRTGTVTIALDSRKLRDLGLTQTTLFLGAFPGDHTAPEKAIPVTAILLPQFDNMNAAQQQQAPRMRLSAENIDLGSFGDKEKKRGTIDITNEGHSTLDIRSLQMFTAGLEVSLNKSKIAPGETARLKVTATASDLRTTRTKPRILMITNDPDNAKVIIKVIVKE